MEHKKLKGKPLFAFGASSGGAFVGSLPFVMHVDGIISQISGIHIPKGDTKEELVESLKEHGGDGAFPPTVFSHMGASNRDEMTANFVKRAQEHFKGLGVPVRETLLEPLPISETFFSERAPATISKVRSKAVAESLKAQGLLDAEGYLKEDPRSSEWRDAVAPHAGDDTLIPDQSTLSELLNVAYSLHELSADHFGEDVAWLASQNRAALGKHAASGGKDNAARVNTAGAQN